MYKLISGLMMFLLSTLVTYGVWAESLDELKLRAKQGDANAQLHLGMMYSRGMGVTEDITEAKAWLRKAVELCNTEAKAELARVSEKDGQGGNRTTTVQLHVQPIVGSIPTGSCLLEIQTTPPDVKLSVFSGYTFLFSGVTPFHNETIRAGEYNICYEKLGYDLFWKTIGVSGQTPTVAVTLRPVDPQRTIMSCIDDNRLTQSREIDDARDMADKARKDAEQKRWEAENIQCFVESRDNGGVGIAVGSKKNIVVMPPSSVTNYRVCIDIRTGREISRERIKK